MAAISNLNIGSSALDLDTLYSQLEAAEQQSLTPITNQATEVKNQISAFGQLKSALTNLQTATTALNSVTSLNATSVTSNNQAFTATSNSNASVGSYQIKVDQLAKAQSLLSSAISSNTQALGNSETGTRTLTIATGDNSPVVIDLADKDTSLNGLVSAINKSDAGVVATSIKANNGEYYLSITAKDTGEKNAISLTVEGDDQLASIIGFNGDNSQSAMQQTVAGQDAKLTVNGIEIQSASNTVEDAPYGVTLNLKATSASEERLDVANNTADAVKNVKAWVTAYNNLQSVIASTTSFAGTGASATDTSSNGPLMGNGTVRDIQNQLRSILTTAQSGSISIMAELGITQSTVKNADGSMGTLDLDESKLSAALSDNPQAVYQFFLGDGKTTGFSTQTDKALDSILSDSIGNKGVLTNAVDSLNKSYDQLESRYDQTQSRIDATMARYKTQFSKLNTLLTQMNQTKDYLTAQFSTSDD